MKRLNIISLSLIGVGILVNLLSLIKPMANLFSKVQRLLLVTIGAVNGFFPFSVGEILIVIAVIFVIGVIVCLFIKKVRLRALSIFFFVLSVLFVIMTFDWLVLYKASSFEERYLNGSYEYKADDMYALREYIVKECNELSKLQKRDSEGKLIYEGDLEKEAVKAMKKLGETYGELSGFYPKHIKKIRYSGLMSQQYIAGVYYPFSLEANVNSIMYISNYPAVMCHELAHLKGFINEDEANFIAFLACVNSDDVFFRYSGYLSVLNYVCNDAEIASRGHDWEFTPIEKAVVDDDIFLEAQTWKKVEEKAVISTEKMVAVSDKTIDTYLKINGVEAGIESYNAVVRLLLKYGAEE